MLAVLHHPHSGGAPIKRWLCIFLHDWSSWSAATDESITEANGWGDNFKIIRRVQGRFCHRCGNVQERVVRQVARKRIINWQAEE